MRFRIKELRKQKGLTQLQVSEMIGTSRAYLTQIESGTRRVNEDLLDKIAAALGCKPSDLIDDGGVPESVQRITDLVQSMEPNEQQKVLDYALLIAGALKRAS